LTFWATARVKLHEEVLAALRGDLVDAIPDAPDAANR
jgi:hypothetical protein